jgi:hypothetical protein
MPRPTSRAPSAPLDQADTPAPLWSTPSLRALRGDATIESGSGPLDDGGGDSMPS